MKPTDAFTGSQSDERGGTEGREPFHRTISVVDYAKQLRDRKEFMRSYSLYEPAFDVLVTIVARWRESRRGSSIYSLSAKDRHDITSMGQKVRRLEAKGFVSVIGRGNMGCKVYGPTAQGLTALSAICNVA